MLHVWRRATLYARQQRQALRTGNQKRVGEVLGIVAVTFLGFAANCKAQVQQTISFSLTVFNQTETGIRAVRVSTKDVIANMVGTNVPGGRLYVVMPSDPAPDDNGNIGAFLRATDARGNILAETTSDSFNIYQPVSSQTPGHIIAWNQFSLAISGLFAEVYGTATWSKGFGGPGGQGSFHCSVSGHCGVGGITDGDRPCIGSVSGGAPRPA